MHEDAFYTSPEWLAVRDERLALDGRSCTVSRLLGGDCGGVLHVHHVWARSKRPDLELDLDNLLSVCASHHPTLEAVTRTLQILRGDLPRCGHNHPYREGRLQCERRRREQMLERRIGRLARVAA